MLFSALELEIFRSVLEMEIKLKQQTVNCGNLHLPAPVLWLIIFLSEFLMNVFRDLIYSQADNTSSFPRWGVASLNLIIGFSS